MSLSSLRPALVTVATVAVLLPAAPAAAQTVDTVDATADVHTMKYDESTDTTTFEPVGTRVNVDLTQVTVNHGARKVVVKARYDSLARTGSPLILLTRLRTNEGIKRDVVVDTFERAAGTHTLETPRGRKIRCSGMKHEVDYAADTVTVSVPRACLSAPRWVQGFHVAFGFDENFDAYIDHGHTDGMDERARWTERVARG